MKAIFQILIVLLGFLAISPSAFGQKKNIKTSKWQTTTVIIDGKLDGDKDVLRYYDKRTRISYDISNDSTTIYLQFKVGDEIAQMKILRAGMVVGLDTVGKSKQHISIQYPMEGMIKENPERRQDVRPTAIDIRNKFKLQAQFMVLNGFNSENGMSPLQSNSGIVVRLDWNTNNEMIYEVAIPLSSFGKGKLSSSGNERIMSLNVTLNAVEKPEMNSSAGQSGGGSGPPPGVGGRPSWVSDGGQSGDFSRLFEKQKVRVKFRLFMD
ncbi:MAG: hypothetical protein ABFS32_19450 [Bacteroidota bacterium]